MTDTELRRLLTEPLGDVFLQRNGQILYSGIDTLRPGDFYFVGFNPAADGTNPRLCEVPLDRQHWSAYTQQCWKHKHEESAVCSDAGRAPHQRRVQGIMAELGLQAEETFAANLIFVESRNTEEIKEEIRNGLFETCWQVHQKMLAVVRPKYIVCLGNGESDSAFSFVREKAADIKEEKLSKEKVGRYVAFKTFVGKFELDDGLDLAAKVIGVLHPSRWKCPHVLREWVLQDN